MTQNIMENVNIIRYNGTILQGWYMENVGENGLIRWTSNSLMSWVSIQQPISHDILTKVMTNLVHIFYFLW